LVQREIAPPVALRLLATPELFGGQRQVEVGIGELRI